MKRNVGLSHNQSKSMGNLDKPYNQEPAKNTDAHGRFTLFRKKGEGGQQQPGGPHKRISKQCVSTPDLVFKEKDAAAIIAADKAAAQPRQQPCGPSIPSYVEDMTDIDQGSIVSEVTLLTYSAEKAEMVMEEFYHRMIRQQQQGSKKLTLEEKEALLREIQQEQEWKIKRQKKEDEKKKTLWRQIASDSDPLDLGRKIASDSHLGRQIASDMDLGNRDLGRQIASDGDLGRQNVSDRGGFFDRLNSLRVHNKMTMDGSELQLTQPDDIDEGEEDLEAINISAGNWIGETMKQATELIDAGLRVTSSYAHESNMLGASSAQLQRKNLSSSFSSTGTMKHRRATSGYAHESNALSASSPQMQSNNLTSSFSSIGTMKHRNTPQGRSEIQGLGNEGDGGQVPSSNADWTKCYALAPKQFGERDESGPQETQVTHQEILHAQPQQAQEAKESTPRNTGAVSETSSIRAHINNIIDLKILVANQQATIDTLYTKLHNLELEHANCQPMTNGLSRMKNLEAGNHNLALDSSLRKELNSQHQPLDDSNKEEPELEGKTLDLMKENSDLATQLNGALSFRKEHQTLDDSCKEQHVLEGKNLSLMRENSDLASKLNGRLELDESFRKELKSQHQLLDTSNKEQHELEGKNLDLMRENSDLRRQLRELRNNVNKFVGDRL